MHFHFFLFVNLVTSQNISLLNLCAILPTDTDKKHQLKIKSEMLHSDTTTEIMIKEEKKLFRKLFLDWLHVLLAEK